MRESEIIIFNYRNEVTKDKKSRSAAGEGKDGIGQGIVKVFTGLSNGYWIG